MQRFYQKVGTIAAATGHGVSLDGRSVRTPAKAALVVPSEALARTIAAEWDAQAEKIDPHTMPMTKLASTAIDRVSQVPEAVAGEILRYAGTDLLCYRAALPRDLAERQSQAWQPLLEWAAVALDARLCVSDGILPVTQPAASLESLAAAIGTLDSFALTAVADLTASTGSVILALAVERDRLSGTQAADAALLDNDYQSERWGEDREEVRRLRRLRGDIEAAARFLALLRTRG